MNRTSIQIDGDAQELALHLASVAVIATRMLHRVLSLSSPALAEFLNSGESAARPEAFEAHRLLAEHINASAAIVFAMLAQWGVSIDIPSVDGRAVVEKLAEQYRALGHDGTRFFVTDLPRPEIPTEPAGAALAV